MSNKLTFIKNDFLKKSQFDFVINSELLASVGIEDFEETRSQWNKLRQKALQASDEHQMKSYIKQMGETFHLKIWSSIYLNQEKFNPEVKDKLASLYLDCGCGNADIYIENLNQSYEKIAKQSKFFDWFAQKNYKKRIKQLEEKEDLRKEFQQLCDKYSIASLDFSASNNKEDTTWFFKKLSQELEGLCEDMKISPAMIGLNKKISYSMFDNAGGIYFSDKKKICFNNPTRATILHEWIHAVDNIVCENLNENNRYKFSTHYTELVQKPISSYSDNQIAWQNAHHQLKNILNGIRNSDENKVNAWIKEKEDLGVTKFWAVILGDAWYALTEEQRKPFLNEEMKIAVVNYCTNPDEENKAYLNWQMRRRARFSGDSADQAIDFNHEKIVNEIGAYFKESQSSPILERSLLLRACNSYYSKGLHLFNNFLVNVLEKTSNLISKNEIVTSNSSSIDYYTEPCELLARYFEANKYPISAQVNNMLALSFIYPFKDSKFEEKKEKPLN